LGQAAPRLTAAFGFDPPEGVLTHGPSAVDRPAPDPIRAETTPLGSNGPAAFIGGHFWWPREVISFATIAGMAHLSSDESAANKPLHRRQDHSGYVGSISEKSSQ
jgi:hypothetical protein